MVALSVFAIDSVKRATDMRFPKELFLLIFLGLIAEWTRLKQKLGGQFAMLWG